MLKLKPFYLDNKGGKAVEYFFTLCEYAAVIGLIKKLTG